MHALKGNLIRKFKLTVAPNRDNPIFALKYLLTLQIFEFFCFEIRVDPSLRAICI